MKSFTYVLLFSGITLASGTTFRTRTVATNFALDARGFSSNNDNTFGNFGHLSKLGGCQDANYAPCPNANGCCPIGVTCTATGCDIPCTSVDIPCGSGCCDPTHVCTADFTCALPTGGGGGGTGGGAGNGTTTGGGTGGGTTGGGTTGGGAGGGTTGGGTTGGAGNGTTTGGGAGAGNATCLPGQFACQDSEGGCCPNGTQCLPNFSCSGPGTGTGGATGTGGTGNTTTTTGGSGTGGSSTGGSSTIGSGTGSSGTGGSGTSGSLTNASNNIRIPTFSSMVLTMTPLLYYLLNQL